MSPTPRVSVITACLNAGKTIRRTIESVLSQTFPGIEHIIIDGASIDSTLDIVGEYRVSRVVSEPDSGISAAFNKGIRASTGDVIQLLNADDRFESNDTVLRAAEALQSDPGRGFVFGDIIIDGSPPFVWRGNPQYGRSIRFVARGVHHPTMFVRRNLYDRYGLYDEKLKLAMDYEWILRVHQAGERGLYAPGVVVRMGEGGLSSSAAREAFREVREVSILHGLHPMLAYSYYFARIMKRRLLFPQISLY